MFAVSHRAAGRRDGETIRHTQTCIKCQHFYFPAYNNVAGVCRVVAAGLLWVVGDSEV